ncbi:amidase [Pseudovirgaria hyperparasitica]|uniref:Amidase n=1 Tax=Pseudovirgaria hyperparasitica TaxID=470096 RepID=A0A6A6VXM0_9PEZI|nr:amidase [Pseudovirgaria hyperparasitica]KAF2754925.1 amidase [Pseudovirgaria hyperparasitica]
MTSTKRKTSKPKRPWQDVAHEAQQYRDRTVAAVRPELPALPSPLPRNVMAIPGQILSQRELYITSLSVSCLLDALAGRGVERITAVDVINAFLRRAALAQRLTNCVTELLTTRALGRAKELDDYFEKHGKTVGPLHGLPISVKEQIGMAGLGLNASFVALWDKVATEDAHVLQILHNAGAIFHARTAEPQTMMHLETSSNLYGRTVNPYNSDLSSGGSSGGEGALGGLGGTVLGLGSDVGGSIRSPAANNGIYGLRPSAFRVPTDGWSSVACGVDEIATVIGPLSSSLSGIEILMQTVLSARPWLTEPALIPMPWTPFAITGPLKIAIMWHDDVVLPHPPITRVLKSMASAMQALENVTVVDWKPYLHDEAWAIVSTLYYPDGGVEDIDMLESADEPILPLTRWIIQDNPCVRELSMQELNYWKEEREAYRKEYAQYWHATSQSDSGEVDVILCPVGPGCAPKHETAKYWGYTSQWNLLDYPAVVFPVGKANREADEKKRDAQWLSGQDKMNWDLYEPETFDGVPISLQLVARRCEDEKLLAVAKWLQEKLEFPFR